MAEAVKLDGITKSFGDKHVLRGISFAVEEGEIVGYIGANGAGKSTTVKILLGLLQADSGTFYISGEAIQPGELNYKSKIGYVPEQTSLYETLTLEEYMQFSGRLYGLTGAVIMDRLKPMLEVFELENELGSMIASFSKGMRQKLLIMASLLHNPKILFWDEPLSGLDANTVMVVKEIMSELSRMGKTIFYSSHNLDTVEKLSHRILLLNEGEIVANGSYAELQGENSRSLEIYFNEVTGHNNHQALAKHFISELQEE